LRDKLTKFFTSPGLRPALSARRELLWREGLHFIHGILSVRPPTPGGGFKDQAAGYIFLCVMNGLPSRPLPGFAAPSPSLGEGSRGGENLHFEIDLLSGEIISVTRMAGTGAGAGCYGITGFTLWAV